MIRVHVAHSITLAIIHQRTSSKSTHPAEHWTLRMMNSSADNVGKRRRQSALQKRAAALLLDATSRQCWRRRGCCAQHATWTLLPTPFAEHLRYCRERWNTVNEHERGGPEKARADRARLYRGWRAHREVRLVHLSNRAGGGCFGTYFFALAPQKSVPKQKDGAKSKAFHNREFVHNSGIVCSVARARHPVAWRRLGDWFRDNPGVELLANVM